MSAFTEANKQAFNDLASRYNAEPWQQKLMQQVSDALQDRKTWIGAQWVKPNERSDGRDVRLLDYACGTGVVTKALGPFVTTIRAIDISENMVHKYNEAASISGQKPEIINAVVGDLFAEAVPTHLNSPQFQNFDVAVVTLGFHHFEDPALAVKRLAERLKPETGVLVISDFLPFDDDRHDMKHTIKHSGFDRDMMKKLFENAGLEDFSWDVLDEDTILELKHGTTRRRMFFARGRRPPTAWGKFSNWVSNIQHQVSGQLALQPDH